MTYSDITPIDAAHAAMEADPQDDAARLSFYGRVVDAELFLVLDREALGETLDPRVFTLVTGPVVAAFDSEARLAEFSGSEVAYAALPGRRLIEVLAGQGLGLGLNLGVAQSAFLMPPEAVDWLARTLLRGLAEADAQIAEVQPPTGLPEQLLVALDRKLSRAGGLASRAYLSGVTYADGRRGHLLALIDAEPGARSTIAAELAEALTFSGVDTGELDVSFFDATQAISARLARVGLRFDLPAPEPRSAAQLAPGMDRKKPPKLK